MERGDVWIVTLPFTGRREQAGERPAVIIQDAVRGQGSPLVLIALLTSQLAALRFPASIRVEPTPQNGLSVPSVAMVFQTRALDRSRFVQRIGSVSTEVLDAILSALDHLTG